LSIFNMTFITSCSDKPERGSRPQSFVGRHYII